MIYFSKATRSGWQVVGAMLAVMLAFQLADIESLRYQSNWWSSGEYWRLLTAHWVHVNWPHLLLNALGLVLCIGIAAPRWSLAHWLVMQLLLALGISMLFTLFNPQLQWYLGYSGVLFGTYLLAAVDLFGRDKLVASLLAGGIIGKVLLEQIGNLKVTTSELIGTPVIIDAHLYGLLLATVLALAGWGYRLIREHYHASKNAIIADQSQGSKSGD